MANEGVTGVVILYGINNFAGVLASSQYSPNTPASINATIRLT